MEKKFLKFGFTLVELLVVVALIGVLAVAVLSTINPIEQSNRARDAKYRNDSAELVNAVERYYAAHQGFPWSFTTPCDPGTSPLSGNPFFQLNWVGAQNASVGVCALAGACSSTNVGCLIGDLELKSEFANRSAFTTTAADPNIDRIYVGRGSDSSATFYACFIPKSQAKRSDRNTLRQFTIGGALGAGGAPGACPAGAIDWANAPCYSCVPE